MRLAHGNTVKGPTQCPLTAESLTNLRSSFFCSLAEPWFFCRRGSARGPSNRKWTPCVSPVHAALQLQQIAGLD